MFDDNKTFVALALAGEVMIDEIDDFVDLWHSDTSNLPLHAYLGMTVDEYGLWVRSPDTLALILASRKLNKPLRSIANDNLNSMRLAARADNALKIKRLEAWLDSRRVQQ